MVRVMERHFVETKECYFPAALCVFGGGKLGGRKRNLLFTLEEIRNG